MTKLLRSVTGGSRQAEQLLLPAVDFLLVLLMQLNNRKLSMFYKLHANALV